MRVNTRASPTPSEVAIDHKLAKDAVAGREAKPQLRQITQTRDRAGQDLPRAQAPVHRPARPYAPTMSQQLAALARAQHRRVEERGQGTMLSTTRRAKLRLSSRARGVWR